MKFSFVMGYYNRRKQFLKTLETIRSSAIPDSEYEIIVVDDGSDAEHDLSDISKIKLIKFSRSEKTWVNPVIAYNRAIVESTGEWVIIQNPEVAYEGDFLTFLDTHARPDTYYATEVLAENNGWYSHPMHRPCFYHFCTAIHRSKLELIGGFNSDMKNGIDYDDNEILERIKRVCRLEYVPIHTVHQWHPSFSYQRPDVDRLREENKKIFEKTCNDSSFIYCDPLKI